MFNHTKIFGIKDIRATLILIYRHIFARSGLFDNRIFPAAWMGTGSLIGISSGKKITQKTSSGIRDTHCTMDKAFNLHLLRDMVSDLSDFFQRQLSCRHDSFGPLLPPEVKSAVIRVICLGTNMPFNLRTDLLCHLEDCRICNNQCIRSHLLQFSQIFPDTLQIRIMCQDIHCNMYLCSVLMCKCNSFPHVISRKVLCFCAQTKCLTADVHRISTKYDRSLQYFQTAGRDQ